MRKIFRRLAVVTMVVGLVQAHSLPGFAVGNHALIEGTGSSWAANAVNQWVADVKDAGVPVTFSSTGSAIGRHNFSLGVTDFAVSDIGFRGQDKRTGAQDTSSRKFAYLPIVAGGTAFPYKILVGGKPVTNLRLSALTVARIFMNEITSWDDPAITADNNGRAFPKKKITPVVNSQGAGSTAQFTLYLKSLFPDKWMKFNGGDPEFTEYFPAPSTYAVQNGSDGVMSYIQGPAGDGAIGYDEYSYALAVGYPVAKIQNAAGVYTLPTQYNDAVALTAAEINMDTHSTEYLLQKLDQVYRNPDKRTYPLSSYSYGIIPTDSADKRMTTAKRQTLSDFLFYSVCGGQSGVGGIGYSSLPYNLVVASFNQIATLKAADPGVDLSQQAPVKCDNPTFDKTNLAKNKLAEIAPLPPACDYQGQGPCTDGNPANNGGGGNSSGGGGGSNVKKPTASKNVPGAVGQPAAATSGLQPQATIDPGTGVPVALTAGDGGGDAYAQPTELANAQRPDNQLPFAVLALLLLLALLVVPPIVGYRMTTGKGK